MHESDAAAGAAADTLHNLNGRAAQMVVTAVRATSCKSVDLAFAKHWPVAERSLAHASEENQYALGARRMLYRRTESSPYAPERIYNANSKFKAPLSRPRARGSETSFRY